MLAGCNGGWWGETSDDAQQDAANAQGYWIGTASTGNRMHALVTAGGAFWAIEPGNTSTSLFQGSGNLQDTTFSGNGSRYDAGTVSSGTFTSQVTTKQTLSGSLSAGGTIQFNLRYDSSYESSITTSAVSGTWDGADGTSFVIDSSGTFTGHSLQNGDKCDLNGKLTAHSTKRYFTVTLQYANGTACLNPGKNLSGIAMLVKGSETNQFLLGATSPDGQTALAANTRK